MWPPTREEHVQQLERSKARLVKQYRRGLITQSQYQKQVAYYTRAIPAARRGYHVL